MCNTRCLHRRRETEVPTQPGKKSVRKARPRQTHLLQAQSHQDGLATNTSWEGAPRGQGQGCSLLALGILACRQGSARVRSLSYSTMCRYLACQGRSAAGREGAEVSSHTCAAAPPTAQEHHSLPGRRKPQQPVFPADNWHPLSAPNIAANTPSP